VSGDRQGRAFGSREVLWVACGLVSLLVVCTTILLALGKDITALKDMATVVALPLLTVLGTAIYSKVSQVHEQVNGRMTQLIDSAQNSVPLDKLDQVKK
jgi:choline-glycine betaine transporter